MGSIEANLNAFNETIKKLQNQNLVVFDQMPFEEPIRKLWNDMLLHKGNSDTIFTDFYYPLFETGLISTFYFMPNWESSIGARLEHEKAKELNIKVVYL